MQRTAMQEQMDRIIPEWCAANGLADDPVKVSRFKELAVKMLGILPGEPSQDTRAPSLGPHLRLADECLLADTVTDDSLTQSPLRPSAKAETLLTQDEELPGTARAEQTARATPRSTACSQSPSVEWMPDCSGDWRPLLHGGDWWVVGHYLMYPAGNKADAERLCQELAS